MIVPLYVAKCDLCKAICVESLNPTSRGARRAAASAGWGKTGRVRTCPPCAPKAAATTPVLTGANA